MTTKTEQTKREMYDLLESMRKAKKHPSLLAKFESALEAHLEDLREWKGRAEGFREERDQIQQRLHAIDHAYLEQSQRNGEQARQIEKLEEIAMIAGEELIAAQESSRKHAEEVTTTRKQLSDAMVLVRRQRAAIGHLFMSGGQSNSAVATLQRLGYTDCGGQLWKPPLGKKPEFVDAVEPTPVQCGSCWRCGTPQ